MNSITVNGTIVRRRIAVFFLLSFFGTLLPAEERELTLADVLSNLLVSESSIKISGATAKSVYEAYRDIISRAFPEVAFSGNLYGYQSSKAPVSPGSTELEAMETHTASPGISITQLLPTAGTLSLLLEDSISAVRKGEETFISQKPSLILSLSQPMFLNGKIIDFSLYSATFRKGEISWQNSLAAGMETVNAAVTGGATYFLNAVNLQKQVMSLERAVKISETRLRQQETLFEQGHASRSDVRELELKVGKLREGLLEIRYKLKEVLKNLSRMTGLAELSESRLSDAIPVSRFPDDPGTLLSRAVERNPDIVAGRFDLEQVKLQGILDGTAFQSVFSMSFTISPKYPAARGAGNPDYVTDSFGASWSDLFAEGSWYEWGVGMNLKIPLYNGGRRSHQVLSQKAKEAAALEKLETKRKTVTDKLDLVLMKRGFLTERAALLEATVRHQEEIRRRVQKLLELKSATQIEMSEAELDYSDAVDRLWFARAELFLNTLDLLTLAGEDLTRYPGIMTSGIVQ